MRRSCSGSRRTAFRVAAKLAQPVTVSVVSMALLSGTPGLALADPAPAPDRIAALIADVAEANQRLQDLAVVVQIEKEDVNKALVDVQTARDNATATQHDVEVSRQGVKDADAAISAAQRRFDKYAAATYVNGPSDSYLSVTDPSDVIATATAGEMLSVSSQQVLDNLQAARTEQVNTASTARLAKDTADRAVADAQSSQDAAVAALTGTQRRFGVQQQEVTQLAAQRSEAQAKLDAARRQARPAQDSPAPSGARWESGAAGASPAPKSTGQWAEWDPTLPMVPSAFVSGDPIAVINTLLGMSASSAQATASMGRKFLQSVGLIKPDAPAPVAAAAEPGINNGRIPRVYGRQASEYVIRRGISQIGVPYSWGGGNAMGPSRGIDGGANTVGFDCSGLVLYSFAGVGIKLPHYSGSQYKLGRQIPSAQMRRGDVIFYGPGGSQHVTMYLGDGQMLEAPDVGETVKVSPVRTSGMTPYVVRYIEY